MRKNLLFAGALSLLPCISVSFADQDTSADAANGFASTLARAPGVILQVPIDSQGRELADSARMHVVTRPVSTAIELENAFANGIDASHQPQISKEDVAKDSSTFGWYTYSYYPYGSWAPAYYYYTYTPVYYYGGYYYNYGPPVYYYNNWYNSYRYYYYPYYYYY
jgi:hypothetical protein